MKVWIKCLIIGFTIALQSCGSKKLIVDREKLPKVKESTIIEALDSISKTQPFFVSTRADTKYSDKKQNVAFKTTLKVHQDTAVHALISYAGIPIVTAMVTDDTVKISNKKDKCYMIKDLDFLEEQFGYKFTLGNLEELLLGLPLNFDRNRNYFAVDDPYTYAVSTQRNESKDKGELLYTYHLTKDLKHLKRVEITSFKEEVNIVVNYLEFFDDAIFEAPQHVNVEITTPKNKISVVLLFDRLEVNVPKDMIIVIPDSYEMCR